MKRRRKISSAAVALLPLALLTVVSCSEATNTANTTSSENAATTEDRSPAQATNNDDISPNTLSPDPAFDPLLSTLKQMTTAPIMLPATLPPQLKNVAIGNDPNNEGGPYTTSGNGYTILFLNPSAYPPPDPTQIIQPYAHYKVSGTLTASPDSDHEPSLDSSGATTYQLGNVTLPNGSVADLKRVVPPEGANYVPFTEGTFEEEGERYMLRTEIDTPEGDLARQILSTMVRVPDGTKA